MSSSPHLVVVVAHDGLQSLDAVGPAEVFNGASALQVHRGQPPAYEVALVSRHGGVLRTESAVRLDTDAVSSVEGTIDTLVVPGGLSVWRHGADDDFVAMLRTLIARSTRIVSVCTGAHLVACTGALDGHTVATHWARADRIADAHPDVEIDAEPIFVHSPGLDGSPDIWSSAGVTAGIDLSLALVEHDHGSDLAQEVARWLVMYLRRPGGQSQFASPTWIREAPDGPIRTAQAAVVDDPGGDHRLPVLARRVALSERHFVRRFTDEVGISPGKFISLVRVDAARDRLVRTDDPVPMIARSCGFGSSETLRRRCSATSASAPTRTAVASPTCPTRRSTPHDPTDRRSTRSPTNEPESNS